MKKRHRVKSLSMEDSLKNDKILGLQIINEGEYA